MKVVICAGGTGGHMFPACALFQELRDAGHDVCMITDKRGAVFSSDVVNKIVFDTIRVSSKLWNIVSGCYDMCRILLEKWRGDNCPDVIVSFGGILTFLPSIIAKIKGVKLIVYEQNAIIGKANKWLSYVADLKVSTFALCKTWMQVAAPVRHGFVRNVSYTCDGPIKILIIGGSQGAKSFSDIMPRAFARVREDLRKDMEIVQQIDDENREKLSVAYSSLNLKYRLERFVSNVAEEMSSAQLVICRAGASTLSELSAIGCPAILIPYPNAAGNHQLANALYYQRKEAAWCFEESDDIELLISEKINEVLSNRELLKNASLHMMNDSIQNMDTMLNLIERVGR